MNIAYNVKMHDPALDFLCRKKQKITAAKFSFPPHTDTEKLIVKRVRRVGGKIVAILLSYYWKKICLFVSASNERQSSRDSRVLASTLKEPNNNSVETNTHTLIVDVGEATNSTHTKVGVVHTNSICGSGHKQYKY